MFDVDDYLKVRFAVQIERLSERAAARRFGIDPRTVAKMMAFSVPRGYVRTKPPVRPKLDAFVAIIDKMLADDKGRPKKQQHTSKRIFERLRDEHVFSGGITIVKDYVAGVQQRSREMFVPLVHPPGHAQADFGEALAIIGGVEQKIHYFAYDLPHSDANFVVAYPAETTEAFCDGHVQAFAYFADLSETGEFGVPQSILYDNTKIAVAKILGDGKRQRTRVFTELQSHYLFRDRFGRPAKGNDKGKVEGLVGYARRNFMVPVPVFDSFAALNAHLAACCRKRLGEVLRGATETIGVRLQRDLAAFRQPLPPAYDACEKVGTRVSSLSLVRYRLNDYSVPTSFGHREVFVRGYVHEVVIACGTEIIARHPRSYAREDFVFDPLHYLALIERKINALDQAAPLADWTLPEEFAALRRLLEARMGKAGKREFVQVLRLLETFAIGDVAAAVRDAIQRGAVGFDAIKHLVLCRIERRPPRLDMTVYPYLPKATVATTSARAYMDLLVRTAA
jgi:transposase